MDIVLERFEAFDPHTEVRGFILTSLLDCIANDEVRPILRKYHLTNISPAEWYPQTLWLDILTDLYYRENAMTNMIALGIKMSKKLPLPPHIKTIEEALYFNTVGYQSVHRNGDTGIIQIKKVSDRHIQFEICTPYPDDLQYGIRYGIALRFLPPGATLQAENLNGVEFRRKRDLPCICDIQW